MLDSKKLLARVVEKWPAKVLSVVVAILLFVFHRMSDLQERFFSIPIRLEINNNLVPSSQYPRNIRVTLRGDANSIYPIAETDLEVYLDLTKYHDPGTYKAPVQVLKKGTALEVETLELVMDPMEITVELDTKFSKYVPLVPAFQGNLEQGYELVSYTLEPNQVVIDGPMGIISSVAELSTEFIELRGRNADFSSRMRIASPNPLLVIRGDGITEFRGFIRELIMIRNFTGLPIAVLGLEEGLWAELDTDQGSIRLEGSQRALEEYVPPPELLFVDCSDLDGAGVYTLPVKASSPPEFSLSRQEPAELQVRIHRGE